jgi:hypothetical protein
MRPSVWNCRNSGAMIATAGKNEIARTRLSVGFLAKNSMRASAYAESEPITRQMSVVIPAMTSVLARPARKMGSMNTVW